MTADEINFQLQEEIARLRNLVQQLSEQNAALKQEIAVLKERLNKNSRNSSKPPSTDGFSKPKPTSLRTKSARKPGAQKGHAGHGFVMTAPVNETIVHKPALCANCTNNSICKVCGKSPARNVIDVKISTTVTQHYVEKFKCPLLGNKVISGRFPQGINSSFQYGNGIRALAIALNTSGMMSVDRVNKILKELLGVPISSGTVAKMIQDFAALIMPVVEEIKQELLNSPVVNCDETGTRVDGKQHWLHSACNNLFTYLSLQRKRGFEGMRNAGFLTSYTGTIVHDCLASYWKFQNTRHGLCGAHLLRELQGIVENDPKASWAQSMQNLLREICHIRNEAAASGETAVPQSQINKLMSRFSIILGKARRKYFPGRGRGKRPKKGACLALIDRLIKYKDEVFACIRDLRVPFTNNLAEQSLRMMKIKNKVSGCFRSLSGGANFVAIMSYLQTAMKHEVAAFKAILNALGGKSFSTIFS